LRYTDDFVIISTDRLYLEELIPTISEFLNISLKLELHPKKVTIRKFDHGIDFLGYVVRPHHVLLRNKTKKRIFKKVKAKSEKYSKGLTDGKSIEQSLQSYLGVLSHADAFDISEKLKNDFWFWG